MDDMFAVEEAEAQEGMMGLAGRREDISERLRLMRAGLGPRYSSSPGDRTGGQMMGMGDLGAFPGCRVINGILHCTPRPPSRPPQGIPHWGIPHWMKPRPR